LTTPTLKPPPPPEPPTPKQERARLLLWALGPACKANIDSYKTNANAMGNTDLKLAMLLRDLQFAHENLRVYANSVKTTEGLP
jgi:hypothetical protein